jgi:hypothetical protein
VVSFECFTSRKAMCCLFSLMPHVKDSFIASVLTLACFVFAGSCGPGASTEHNPAVSRGRRSGVRG